MVSNALQDKIVVVTGAHTPLGQVVSSRMASEGATLVAVFDNMDQAYERFPEGIEGWVVAGNVQTEDGVVKCFRKIQSQFKRVDVLVHTIQEWDRRPIEKTTLENWHDVMRANLDSTFLCFRESIRLMQNLSGRLIAITSSQGADKARPLHAAFAASHSGVIRLVEATAGEYAKTDISAHAIATSIVLVDDGGKHGVHANEVADLCVHLSGPAGKALNGSTLRAYGSVV